MTPLGQYALLVAFVLSTIGLVTTIRLIARLLGRTRTEPGKDVPFTGDSLSPKPAWVRYHLHYYGFALLFLAVDMEMAFMYSWAVVYQELNIEALADMIVFLGILFLGLRLGGCGRHTQRRQGSASSLSCTGSYELARGRIVLTRTYPVFAVARGLGHRSAAPDLSPAGRTTASAGRRVATTGLTPAPTLALAAPTTRPVTSPSPVPSPTYSVMTSGICIRGGVYSAGNERQRWFRRGMRYRAGVEGRISVMKRRGYLSRRRDKREQGFNRWVGSADS